MTKKRHLKDIFEKIEVEKDTASLFSMSKSLLGWTNSGAPSCFKVGNEVIRKQIDIANTQVDYYEQKVLKIKNSLPRVNIDPLELLRSAFRRWRPSGEKPKFVLRECD